ncbi:RNA-binding domain-containing protein [Mytilinidion resinicola]|uniref:RNA-binding domain-containing protein n=1 Tax=Mytilinidion resinicola TaxID=574789 RepID=A0A6A6YTD0_9PEZI|nr:RNA-binding domain-containing protein [Mytilinidion resinicola]KAF2811167.1 RNA-binding domain-containing protein [Mytilinidion resinicola]
MASARHWDQDKDATVYVGNLDERVTDQLVWELMLQAGRISNVHMPKDRVTQTHQGYGFVEFNTEEDADYAIKIMNTVRVYGKPLRVNKASADKQKTVEVVGAELFVGNLDPMVDEKVLLDTFGRFGPLMQPPKVARDDSNLSKGYGFVSFADFDASDAAIQNMHGQYLMNKEISVQYAYKKDGKGERHGDEAERMLAAQARKNNVQPVVQPFPAQVFAPPAPSAMLMGDGRMNGGPPAGFGMVPHHGNFNSVPPPHQQRPMSNTPLPPPPAGLPARPPQSNAGYGGPTNFQPPGFPGPPPPAGFGPPPGMPAGFNPPPGFPRR